VAYHAPCPLVDLAVACYLPKSVRLVVHWHAEIVHQKNALKIVRPWIERCLERADAIIVATPNHIKYSAFLSRYRHKCVVIPYAIDYQQLSVLTLAEQQKVEELKATYPKLVLAAGRLIPYKGLSVFIEAMQQVDALGLIVGVGPLEASLKQQVHDLGLQDKVIFVGAVSNQQLKCLLHACQVFAFPSVFINEAFGMVQLEAMACGKPIVNTNLQSGVPWVARDGSEALTVPVADATAFATAVQRLLSDEALATKLGAQGARRVQDEFDLPQFLERTKAVYLG